jgi:hypothetical protein
MEHQITMEEVLAEQESKRVFCRRCGRELKSKQAKELGFGPTCYKRHMSELARSNRKRLFKVEQES